MLHQPGRARRACDAKLVLQGTSKLLVHPNTEHEVRSVRGAKIVVGGIPPTARLRSSVLLPGQQEGCHINAAARFFCSDLSRAYFHTRVQLIILALLSDQVIMRAALDNAALLKDHDAVRIADSRETVSDDK